MGVVKYTAAIQAAVNSSEVDYVMGCQRHEGSNCQDPRDGAMHFLHAI
jgi:hypothetical protein